MDVCVEHGVWLDGGELGEIIDFHASGGPERARAIQIERLDAARRQLEFERRNTRGAERANEG